MKKRIISMFIAVVIILTIIPTVPTYSSDGSSVGFDLDVYMAKHFYTENRLLPILNRPSSSLTILAYDSPSKIMVDSLSDNLILMELMTTWENIGLLTSPSELLKDNLNP